MGLSFGRQPASPLGHIPFAILGQAAQAIPQTPIIILTTCHPSCWRYKPVSEFGLADCAGLGRTKRNWDRNANMPQENVL
jgi:hypothetical protein